MNEQGDQAGGRELDPALEERIAQAIAPVLSDFEQQVVHAVEERLAAAPAQDIGTALDSADNRDEQDDTDEHQPEPPHAASSAESPATPDSDDTPPSDS